MPECITTKSRIEYQFRVFGGFTIVYVEAKLEVGTGAEHLDAVAQLIAEADGMYLHRCPVLTFLILITTGCDHANSYL
jgi:hypothetical protein